MHLQYPADFNLIFASNKHMILETTIAEVKQQVILLDENFISNRKKWEIVNDEAETSYLEKGYYYMHNKTCNRWMYYSKESGLHANDDFIISAKIECLKAANGGNYGILWGIKREPEYLNRFVLGAKGKRFSIEHFERENSYPFIRNYVLCDAIKLGESSINEIRIVKIAQQLYFFVNNTDRPVFQCHESAFPRYGTRIGFYTEPGEFIRAHGIQVRKIITKPVSKSNWKDFLHCF